jgi:hypothetical protein
MPRGTEIGVMASKKASDPPLSLLIASASGRGESGPVGDDHAVPPVRRQARHLLAAQLDQRMGEQRSPTGREKP